MTAAEIFDTVAEELCSALQNGDVISRLVQKEIETPDGPASYGSVLMIIVGWSRSSIPSCGSFGAAAIFNGSHSTRADRGTARRFGRASPSAELNNPQLQAEGFGLLRKPVRLTPTKASYRLKARGLLPLERH
jgi:hypothetical protein